MPIFRPAHTQHLLAGKAMNNIERSIKRESNSSAKSTYAVRIGQKQPEGLSTSTLKPKSGLWSKAVGRVVTRSQT